MNWLNSTWRPALLLVLLFGVILLTIGYDAGFPLYESADERHHLDEVYILRGLKNAPLWIPGYPPGILYINYAAQLWVELQTGQSAYGQQCLVVQSVRIVDIFVNLITTALIASVARKLGGNWAGVLAALAWLVAPRVLQQNQFGFPQVYEGLFYLLALYTALLALEKQQPRYAVLSVLAGLGAVIFKYAIFPVLGLGVGVALWQLRADGKRWLRVLFIQIAAIILTAGAILTLGSVGSLAGSGHHETTVFLEGGIGQLLSLERLSYFLTEATHQVGLSPELFVLIMLVGSVAVWFSTATWQRLGWLGLVGLGLSHVFFMVTYVTKPDLDRNMLSGSGLLVVIVSVALMVVGRWVSTRVRPAVIMKIAIAVFANVWLWPQLAASWRWVNYRDLPVTYGAMAEWVNQNLPDEQLVVSDRRPFSSTGSCALSTGRLYQETDVMTRPIDDWLADDVYYAQLTQTQVEQMGLTPEGRAYLERMTLRQQFPPPGEEDGWRTFRLGRYMHIEVYQLWQVDPDYRMDVTFGDQVRLLGYDLDAAELTPGGTIRLRFYWQPVQPPAADYNVFVHLVAADDPSTIAAQSDGVPSRSEQRPTSTWHDLTEPFLSRDFPLVVPDNLELGEYLLRVGLYDWHSGERLITDDGREFVEIRLTAQVD